jgi:hypothetical protein
MDKTKGTFFISSALYPSIGSSIYNEEERFEQTLETIKSIDLFCDDNTKIIFDSSPKKPNEKYISHLRKTGILFFYFGDDPEVNVYSQKDTKGISETLSFKSCLNFYRKSRFESNRIYKISGRYQINENFILNEDSYKNKFVFLRAIDSHLPIHERIYNNNEKLLSIRLWHMDCNCLDIFYNKMNNIIEDCITYNIDVEHSYYKNLCDESIVQVNKIGVQGFCAPNGVYVNE